ncbi:Variant-specific surface protein, partial [Giardia duodenalis]
SKSASGGSICTKAEGGKCTACNAANGLFKNPAASPTLGSECILCSDATSRDGVMGVANCNKCTAPSGNTGPATCDTCQEGYYKNDQGACTQCDTSCATCSGAGQNACTSCPEGKYLKSDKSCSDTCGGNTYPDPETGTCKESGIADCTTCKYNATVSKPQCTNCGSKKVKYMIDGSTVCIELASGCTDANHFKADDDSACYLCSDTSGTDPNKGVAQCKACTKTASQKPACTDCLEGYIKEGSGVAATCQACGTGCATCSAKDDPNKCSTCMAGFFLVTEGANKKCVPCGDTTQGGIDGCAECDNQSGTLKCTKCKPNRRSKGESGNYTCEEKTCEDDSACGGTAGACDAIVIGASGEMTYYCSLCGDSNQYPIDGLCNGNKGSNTCAKGVCTSCTTGYFLYMGGCYKVDTAPGSLMCSKASTTPGVCETPNANSRYFAVPGATASQQSVLACGNPLGTTTGTGDTAKAYVGVEGCKTCEAPTAPSPAGMAAAKCTACDGGKTLTGSGYGCVMCSIAGCSACRADSMCEACSDGHRLEGDTCVSTGPNLGTGAIAGISVAKSSSALCC